VTSNVDKVNGVGYWFRFITPLMVGVLIMLAGMAISKMDSLCASLDGVKVLINNHIQHDVTEMKLSIARIETTLGIEAK